MAQINRRPDTEQALARRFKSSETRLARLERKSAYEPGDLIPSAARTRAGALLCDGTSYVLTAHPELEALAQACPDYVSAGVLTVPDLQGRAPIGAGAGAGLTARSLGQKLGEETHALTSGESGMPAHTTGTDSPDHAHSGTTNAADRSLDHLHSAALLGAFVYADGSLGLASEQPAAGHTPALIANSAQRGGTTGAADRSIDHLHSFATGGASARHAHAVSAVNASSAHNNMQPSAVINWFIKT